MHNSCGDNGLLSNLTARLPAFVTRVFSFMLLAFLLGLAPAQAQNADDQYIVVLKLIHQADTLNSGGNRRAALIKYRQAQAALNNFQRKNPDWNNKIVTYRVNYLASKIESLSTNAPAPAAAATNAMVLEKAEQGRTAGGGQVKLIDPGAEPRQVLRLHPKAGDKQTFSMSLKMSMAMKMGENEMPAVKMPPMTFTMDATVKDVSADGDISYEIVLGEGTVGEEPGAVPQAAEMMKSILASMKGTTGTGVVTSRGLNKGANFKPPANANPQAKQMMEQMKEGLFNLGLPEEAVGKGAKWQFKMPLKSQGMTMDQTFDYELVSLEGDELTVNANIKQTAAKQKVESPAMPGVKVDLDKLSGSGKGQVTANLAQLLPVKGSTEMHSEMSMGMNAGAQKQTMNMGLDINVEFESK